jgi:O-antigen/teichoic acid export membrane protein
LSGVEVAQRSVRGSLFLLVGNLLSTAILAISSIIIARLLGPASYGSYSLVTLIPSIFQLFVGLGVSSAITRDSSYHISRGELSLAKRFSINGMIFLTFFAVILSLLCFASSGFVSATLLHRPVLAPLVRYVSIVVLAQALLQSSTSGLVGWNSTGLASFATVLQAILRLSIAPILVIYGLGVFGALTGYIVGYLLAGIIAGLAFYAYKLRGPSNNAGIAIFFSDVRKMVSYGLPIFTGTVLTGLAPYYVTVLVAAIASDATVGYYQAALNITAVLTLTSSAITIVLFPAFSSLRGLGADTGQAFRHATKYVTYVMAPVILLLAGSSGLVVHIIYGSAFSSADIYLELLALSNLPSIIGLSVAGAFFNGIGRPRLTMIVSILGAATIFVFAPVLGSVLGLGIEGLIFAILISGMVSGIAGLYFASRYLQATVDLRAIAAIVGASIVGYVAIIPLPLLSFPEPVTLVVEVIVFVVVYFTSAPLLRAVDTSDIERLEISIESLGAVARLLSLILRYELLILKLSS